MTARHAQQAHCRRGAYRSGRGHNRRLFAIIGIPPPGQRTAAGLRTLKHCCLQLRTAHHYSGNALSLHYYRHRVDPHADLHIRCCGLQTLPHAYAPRCCFACLVLVGDGGAGLLAIHTAAFTVTLAFACLVICRAAYIDSCVLRVSPSYHSYLIPGYLWLPRAESRPARSPRHSTPRCTFTRSDADSARCFRSPSAGR